MLFLLSFFSIFFFHFFVLVLFLTNSSTPALLSTMCAFSAANKTVPPGVWGRSHDSVLLCAASAAFAYLYCSSGRFPFFSALLLLLLLLLRICSVSRWESTYFDSEMSKHLLFVAVIFFTMIGAAVAVEMKDGAFPIGTDYQKEKERQGVDPENYKKVYHRV